MSAHSVRREALTAHVIPDSGEVLPLDNPMEFVRVVREFVQGV